MRFITKLTPSLGEREGHGGKTEDPHHNDHPDHVGSVEEVDLRVEDTKEPLKSYQHHDVERHSNVDEENEGEVMTKMIFQTHELTSSVEKPLKNQ